MDRTFQQNELQLDYFSASYGRFEDDFYKYSDLTIPLTFLTDDILLTMARSQKNYFKLNKENARDKRDHYFLFKVRTNKEVPLVRIYEYHSVSLQEPKQITP
ncbi:DUF5960 family protein [Streptococcus cameli]